jgi:hypothetical protein
MPLDAVRYIGQYKDDTFYLCFVLQTFASFLRFLWKPCMYVCIDYFAQYNNIANLKS